MRPRAIPLALFVAAFALAPAAFADSSPEDRAAADALYEEAGKLMKAERWAEACPKLTASLKLDPGIGTTLRLAQCFEKTGRTASAWTSYSDAEAMARRVGDKRADEAARHAKQIEPLLSRLVLDVAPENRIVGVEIRRDGKVIDPGAWASAMPLDPGAHVLEASAPGRLTWKAIVTIEPKPGKTSVSVPPLAPGPANAPSIGRAPFWSTQRIAGAAIGGGGLLIGGLLTGIFGGLTLKKTSDSAAHCSGSPPQCDPTGLSLRSDAKSTAKAADVAMAVGGAALIAGVVVFATAPRAQTNDAVRVEAGPSLGGVVLRGAF